MPYPGHIDEAEISTRAVGILQTGDFNPHFFEYPSLPIYLTTAGFAVGFLDACAKQKIRNTREIGSVSYPYYEQPTVVYPARATFAVLSSIALALVGIVAFELTQLEVSLVLAPLVASISTVYLYLSWRYLNVDVVGAFFVMTTMLYALRHRSSNWNALNCLIVGICCGLTIACKYTLLPILLPGLLATWLSPSTNRALHGSLLVGAATLAFLFATPYALLDFSVFLNDIGGASFHYAHGHPGANGEPGWPQIVFYATRMVRDFGPLSPILAIVGAAYLFSLDWRGTSILLSFPIAHLAYMSLQRVHFMRHMAPSYLCLAVLVAVGLIALPLWAATLLPYGDGLWVSERRVRLTIGTAAVVLFTFTLPWRSITNAYDLTPDSRNLAIRWIKDNLPQSTTLFVPPELGMRTGALQKRFNILPINLFHFDANDVNPGSYVLLPRYGYDHRSPSASTLAAERNEVVEHLGARVLVEFGSTTVSVNYPIPVAGGNPAIRIARLGE
jgi:hypothetical protein